MLIKWLGHSSFYIETQGKKILTDPYDPSIGYPKKFPPVDTITVSHEHSDHNFIKGVPSYKNVVRGSIEKTIDGVKFKGIGASHDNEKGLKRGLITMFKIESEGLSILHLGDLGTLLSKDQLESIGKVNILMIPVGGVYTIDKTQAEKVVEQISPNIVLPMHYKTEYLKFDIDPVDPFLKGKHYTEVDHLDITKDTLPIETQIILLKLGL